jgi:TRAP-type mannitol/chloroaromatic compound transport system substrate-binding protein
MEEIMKLVYRLTVVLAVVAVLATPVLAADKKVRWKLAMTWSSTLTPFATAPFNLAKMVEEMSGGNFVIRVEGSEKHKAALGILDMTKGGQYEMGHSASYYWKGKDISTVFFCTVPFGMNVDEQNAWFYHGGGMELMQEIYDKFGVLSFPGGNTGVQMGGWFQKEINSLEDLKGLKMRIPGLAGEVFAKLGVNVTNIPSGELYTSLDRGTIDALEWVGPAMDIKMGFHKIAPYYYTGWHEPATELQFLINKKAFEELPPEYQTMLVTAMKAVTADLYTDNFAGSVEAWSQMKKDYPNIVVKTFPPEVLAAMKQAADELYDAYAAEDPFFKKVWESQKEYMEKARTWTQISEYNYINTVNQLSE